MVVRAEGSRPGAEYVRVGWAGKAHGYDGGLYLETPAFPGVVVTGTRLWLGGRTLEVESVGGTAARPLVRFDGVGNRGAAAALAGEALWMQRDVPPPLGADEWFGSDLEGMTVVGEDGAPIGVVLRMMNAPSVDVLEVTLDGGGELLVPIGDDAVRSISVERREVVVNRFFLGLDAGESGGDAVGG